MRISDWSSDVFSSDLCLLAFAYRRDRMHAPWSISLPLARRLLGQSWPLLLSGFAVMTYMRIDQIMLATMLDDHAVGVFSAALRVAEVWYFIDRKSVVEGKS